MTTFQIVLVTDVAPGHGTGTGSVNKSFGQQPQMSDKRGPIVLPLHQKVWKMIHRISSEKEEKQKH